MKIFFDGPKHRHNYEKMIARFKHIDFETNGEYRSTCYIAALPQIFKCFDLDKLESGPFGWLFDYFDDPSTFAERMESGGIAASVAPLTGQTWALCKIALSLWNGRECDISDISDLDIGLYLVVLQALDLRRARPSFDYTQYAQTRFGDYDVILRKQGAKDNGKT